MFRFRHTHPLLRRLGACVGVLGVAAAALATPAAGASANDRQPAAPVPSTAVDGFGSFAAVDGGSLIVEGRGNGHGIGMSQYGALGYAIDEGWSYDQILSHYYGGTSAGTSDPAMWLTVRLTVLDEAQTAVIHPRNVASTPSDPLGARWGAIVAREVAPAVYRVWGRADQVCPPATLNLDDPLNGWTVIAETVPTKVVINAPVGSEVSSDIDDLLATCEPNGTVRSYRGSIVAINGTAGENRTINEVPVEQYLRSVVAAEVSASWASLGGGKGVEALKTQAVAARSYALAQNRYSFARTCDTQECQVYSGAAKRAGIRQPASRSEYAEIDMAVAATSAEIRRTSTGAVANTMFSSSSGGWTAPSTSPGFPVVEDLGDDTASNPHHRWRVNVPVATIEQAWPQIGTFDRITVTQRNGYGEWGGRVVSATVRGGAGKVTVTGDDIRKALGLRSSWFAPQQLACPTEEPMSSSAPATLVGLRYVAVAPSRSVDTRNGTGAPKGLVPSGCTLVATLPGRPEGASAVAVTITATASAANGYITAFPCGTDRPNVSAIQLLAGVDVPGTTVVPLGVGGSICLYTSAATHVIVDLLGWWGASGSTIQSGPPTRIVDTRSTASVRPTGSITRIVAPSSVPPDAVAVSVNLTATQATASGFVTAFACDTTVPNASVLNVRRSVDVANRAFMPLGADRSFCLWNSVPMHLIVDLDGWFVAAGGATVDVQPGRRAVDTRNDLGLNGLFVANVVRSIDLGEPTTASMVQVTAVDAKAPGFVTVFPCGGAAPNTSVLNSSPLRNVANLVVMPTDGDGRLCIVTSMSTHLLIDIVGRAG